MKATQRASFTTIAAMLAIAITVASLVILGGVAHAEESAPAAPVVTAEAGYKQVRLMWASMANDRNISHFQYMYGREGKNSTWKRVRNSNRRSTYVVVESLKPGKIYWFRVRAVGKDGAKGEQGLLITTLPHLLSLGGEPGDEQATLRWAWDGRNRDADNVTFQYRQRDGGELTYPAWQDMTEDAENPKQYTATGLSNGYPHTFQVRARTGSDETHSISNEWTVVPVEPVPTIDNITVLRNPNGGSKFVTGETLEIGVQFSELVAAVTLEEGQVHIATLTVQVGKNDRDFACENLNQQQQPDFYQLICSYVVTGEDHDKNGVSINANQLRLNDAVIFSSDSRADADLSHDAVPHRRSAKVNSP